MLSSTHILVPFFGSFATAVNLYATHYSGNVNLLSFSGSALSLTSTTKTGNILPSWITYDGPGKALYIPDETWTGQSVNLVSFAIGANGALTPSGKVSTPIGIVHSTLYGGDDGKSFIANGHYETSSVTTYKLPLGGSQLQGFKYTMSKPGPNAARQGAPHPHQVLVDPTGGFLLAPDLGADLIRIFSIEKKSGKLTECPSAVAAPGSGPRHGVFWSPPADHSRIRRHDPATFLYIADELGGSVSAWTVTYPMGSGCMTLKRTQTLTPYPGNTTAPVGVKIGEVRIRDNFLYSSNRNDKKFSGNCSLSQYTIANDGSITWTDYTQAHGTYPRTFDINKAGDLVAIGLQTTSSVAIVKRDIVTGKLGSLVASLRLGTAGTPENEDGTSAVVWADYSKPNTPELQVSIHRSKFPRLNQTLHSTMKSDQYLNLCLQQATLSPLRHRHGCIIVRGGKVIGQGFNDYRTGFDGGALKTGRLASRCDGTAISELKKKRKLKRESKIHPEPASAKTFTPFEVMGGGRKLANTPFSMHSEMMAIHSALSASSTLASSAVSSQKPCFKLSGGSKRKTGLRREAIHTYAEKVCKASFNQFNGGNSNSLHINRAKLNLVFQHGLKEENDIEKHNLKKNQHHHQNKEEKCNIGQRWQYANELSAQGVESNPPACHSQTFDTTSNEFDHESRSGSLIPERPNTTNTRKGKINNNATLAPTQPMLIPKSPTGQQSYSVTDRMKNPRLSGADLYVARLGWKTTSSPQACTHSCCPTSNTELTPPIPTGSLHDELISPQSTTKVSPSHSTFKHTQKEPSVASSRPCYRCIAYMNSVGIKRVFWTTDTGAWEGAKVRDLVDALDRVGQGDASDDLAVIKDIFVTKHEVLMLRRMMGEI
ncbi:3-carboxy-cis,cis-mucoante lactonizing enzyme [Amniculicola lignicola CBS 123094]|uniref:3-carboxy-cis,cis-mucoante lactonizing enzyme n=1 Tax=Amniculicola lignicola CBS 123094 TaxID=1392246 RepID=A0A6A5WYS5_9PLEO|nr:3-carboxy-cis,cis-mucoante lactonizing enzyme [Amniculicola lignicola CBS 123094]